MGVIFDLDQTIIDTNIALEARNRGEWDKATSLIPKMVPYGDVVNLINVLVGQGIKVAIVSSSPSHYCTKVLEFCGIDINLVTTVFYHDTKEHKPSVEPYKLAMQRMGITSAKEMIVIGDDVTDIIPANIIGATSIWANWGRKKIEFTDSVEPNVMCQDTAYLVKYFMLRGIDRQRTVFRNVNERQQIYALLDYYPMGNGKSTDEISRKIFEELKQDTSESYLCEMFSREILYDFQYIKRNQHRNCGIFIVPSSKANKWNTKLEKYVVPEMLKFQGMCDCSKHIQRCKDHDKLSFGGDRSVESHLQTMRIQGEIPKNIDSAIIIDDITTSGNIFISCKKLLIDKGIREDSIYCYAVGGTNNIWNAYEGNSEVQYIKCKSCFDML